MLTIECPKCGRRGNIPPDRLGSRLHCTACNAVIHLDRTGQLAVDESAATNGKMAEAGPASPPGAGNVRFAETWQEIPKGLKWAVPAVIALGLLMGWIVPQFLPATVDEAYVKAGESVLRAVASNDRERAMALADPATAEDAGRWFDLVRERLEARDIGQDLFVHTTPILGNVDKDARVVLLGTLASRISEDEPPMATNLHINRVKGGWILDGTATLKAEEAGESTGGLPVLKVSPSPAHAQGSAPASTPATRGPVP
ncbi:MAG: hypothetical protein U0800_20275 [Isosphaeraceae bacterium]